MTLADRCQNAMKLHYCMLLFLNFLYPIRLRAEILPEKFQESFAADPSVKADSAKDNEISAAVVFTESTEVLAMRTNSVNAQDPDANLSRILQYIQNNVDFQKKQIVDFLSKEEITIEEFNNKGKLTKTVNAISNYRVFPQTTSAISDCHIVSEILDSVQPSGILREERELLSTKENGRKLKNFVEAVWAKGNNYADLFIIFDKQNEKCFEYVLKGVGKIKDRDVYAIGIKQKEIDIGKNDIERKDVRKNDIEKKEKRISWNLRYEGVALIDAGTMEIVQLNRGSVGYNITYKPPQVSMVGVPVPKDVVEKYVFSTQYEYDKVKIGAQFLTLPIVKTVKLFRDNGPLTCIYKYKYSDYRAFEVSIKIRFNAAAVEEPSDKNRNLKQD